MRSAPGSGRCPCAPGNDLPAAGQRPAGRAAPLRMRRGGVGARRRRRAPGDPAQRRSESGARSRSLALAGRRDGGLGQARPCAPHAGSTRWGRGTLRRWRPRSWGVERAPGARRSPRRGPGPPRGWDLRCAAPGPAGRRGAGMGVRSSPVRSPVHVAGPRAGTGALLPGHQWALGAPRAASRSQGAGRAAAGTEGAAAEPPGRCCARFSRRGFGGAAPGPKGVGFGPGRRGVAPAPPARGGCAHGTRCR